MLPHAPADAAPSPVSVAVVVLLVVDVQALFLPALVASEGLGAFGGLGDQA